jgi:hypothetical protein
MMLMYRTSTTKWRHGAQSPMQSPTRLAGPDRLCDMPHVLPSQAVIVISRLWDFTDRRDLNLNPNIGWNQAGKIASVLAVVDAVPMAFLAVDGATFAEFVEAKAALSTFIDAAHAHGSSAAASGRYLTVIRLVLEKCPDQVVPASVTTLGFVGDPTLRESLRRDIAEVEQALVDGEWKSATVVGGSVIEALLLSGLDQHRTEAQAEGAKLPANGTTAPLENWDLFQYAEVAARLRIIKTETVAQLKIARGFRNLIHPGRAVRLQQNCDRATARAVAAGIDFVTRDLST